MIMSRTTIASLAVAMTLPAAAVAQDAAPKKPIELGIDAAIARETQGSQKITSLVLPVSRLRVGFFLTDAVSLEPAIALSYFHVSNDSDISGFDRSSSGFNYDLDVGLLYHFRTDRTKAQPYVRPFLGLRGFSTSNDAPNNDFPDSGTQVSFGAGLGYKIPLASRVGTRLEVAYSHAGENEPVFSKTNRIFLSLGLSYLTR